MWLLLEFMLNDQGRLEYHTLNGIVLKNTFLERYRSCQVKLPLIRQFNSTTQPFAWLIPEIADVCRIENEVLE